MSDLEEKSDIYIYIMLMARPTTIYNWSSIGIRYNSYKERHNVHVMRWNYFRITEESTVGKVKGADAVLCYKR